MLKGYQRKLVMIRTKESSIFESAFFILRGSLNEDAEDDMIAEANRILRASGGERKKTRCFKARHILSALGIGFLAGAVCVAAFWVAAAL